MSQVELVAVRPEERDSYFLSPERLVFRDGASPAVDLGSRLGKLLVITLEIQRVTEHDGILVSIWGSADKSDWGTTALLTFPTKSYCGVYSALLNLSNHSQLQYLRVHWHVRHWSRGVAAPAFSFSVFGEESGSRIASPRPGYPRLVVRGA